MIIIKQTQRSIPFSTKIYHQKAQKILQFLGYGDFDLGIKLTTNRTIQKYNFQFKKQNKPTDVLSFPYHVNLQAGKKIVVRDLDDQNLGDIIISVPYVFANQKELEGTFQERMDRMLVHGICHLLGYDHVTDVDFKKMLKLENQLLKLIQD